MAGAREQANAIEAFAEKLRELKGGTSHSFESIARRTGVSRSTLHRYCSGKGVPAEFATVERFARCCRADRADLTELHRLWVLATEPPQPETAAVSAADGSGETTGPIRTTAGPDRGAEHPDGPVGAAAPAAPAAADATTGDQRPAEGNHAEGARAWPHPDRTGQSQQEHMTVAARAKSTARVPWWRRRWTIAAVVALLAVVSGAVVWDHGRTDDPATSAGDSGRPGDSRPLFRSPCDEPITMGRHDGCVEEVQNLLAERGATLVIDAQFGPETLRRVTAFQVLAGVGVNGVVGAETKRALYDSDVSMQSWDRERLVEQIHEVFPEEVADTAAAIAACQSLMDPYYILGNENGTRNWGLFQISDSRLRDLGGTAADALDPEANIEFARRLWAVDEDFKDWPFCLAGIEQVRGETQDDGGGGDADGADADSDGDGAGDGGGGTPGDGRPRDVEYGVRHR
ncbi:helix-turn-helix domain-containing protein [Streptomyces sp. SM12]|uniref:helix-turn-helix domain-containing protein n=1 Tax=Streptomyces sp. SM12 TaxID=1071602 RepID=UPI0015E17373|nr:helix-turn-helix domain-containing protein [Streptomyces sp. SM12]